MAIDLLLVAQHGSSSQKILFALLLGVAIGFLTNYLLLSGGDLLGLDGGRRPFDNHVNKSSMANASYIEGKISQIRTEEFPSGVSNLLLFKLIVNQFNAILSFLTRSDKIICEIDYNKTHQIFETFCLELKIQIDLRTTHMSYFKNLNFVSIGGNIAAERLAKEVRILCWVMTSPSNLETKAVHVKATWGKRCNILLFISSANGK
jgi:hypothetical protein